MTYKALFYYSDEDACYLAAIPSLPGCMADGKTIKEALANIKVIAAEWIEDALSDGCKIPEPKAETDADVDIEGAEEVTWLDVEV